jgi:subtilisin family serine protease
MKNFKFYFISLILGIFLYGNIQAQYSTVDSLNQKYVNWHNKDFKTDKVPGVSVDKAYKELLAGKTSKKQIIVAVIDGGVDTAHADLKGKIWKNTDEIAGNGKDDDNNGYIDDVYGWNFIGNAKGENVKVENLEITRVLKEYGKIFQNIKTESDVPANQKADYKMYLLAKSKYDNQLKEYTEEADQVVAFEKKFNDAEQTIKTLLKKEEFTKEDLEGITSTEENIIKAKKYLLNLYSKGFTKGDMAGIKDHTSLYLDKYLNLEYDARWLVGDDPENISDTKYGNNNVKGPDAGHGTLCSGLIAANRNNGFGIDGIAENVLIMAIRVVPDGDERDKDVALAIKYAVDNGANVINMSFGKALSPQKKFVDEAIKYAAAHNVLLIHAAGNDGENNDSIEHYPSKFMNDGSVAPNMITAGASSFSMDKNYAAIFTNYGMSVDLFAPGVNISSTIPENKYSLTNGTSFSCPITSGVAALVWSYYPQLTAVQLKDVLLKSVSKQTKLQVYKPGRGSKIRTEMKFSKLCKTGGTVNAYNALKLAAKISKS